MPGFKKEVQEKSRLKNAIFANENVVIIIEKDIISVKKVIVNRAMQVKIDSQPGKSQILKTGLEMSVRVHESPVHFHM